MYFFIRKFTTTILFFVLVFSLISLLVIPIAKGAGTNRADYYGYYDNKVDYYGGDVIDGGIESQVNNADTLIGFIFKNLAYGSQQNKTGARFIISTMLGKQQGPDGKVSRDISFCPPQNPNCVDSDWSRWTTLVREYENRGWVNFNAQYSYTYNTFYQDAHDDVAGYAVPRTTDLAIVFAVPGTNIDYAIRRACANPVGDFEPLLSLATIYREASVSTPIINANDGGEATFTNTVNTKDLINVPFNDLFTFGVRTIIIENGKGSDNSGATWGAGAALGPYNVRVINPTLTGAGTPAPNYSTAKLTIAKGSTNLIGKKFCRIIDASRQPRYASIDDWTKGLACVTVVGDAGENDARIENINSDYEKGSIENPTNLVLRANIKSGSVFCDRTNPSQTLNVYVVRSVSDGISGETTTQVTVPNCQTVASDISLEAINISPDLLNGKTVGSYAVNTKIYLLPNKQSLLAEHQGTLKIYEAPFVIFGGNDVRACPTSADNGRFVFKPSEPNKGSSSRLASLWSSISAPSTTNDRGWSNSLNTYNNSNKTKAAGIVCDDGFSSSSTTTNIVINATDDKPNPAEAVNVYINDTINVPEPSVYKINATNVYINKNVKYLKNVIINAQNVYTCAGDGTTGAISKENWDNDCTNPLRIEGSINVQNLYLMRSVGTRYKSVGGANQVGVGVTGYDLDDNNDNKLKQPAEVIVYPAYFYFTNVGASGAGSTKGSIDSYSQAAPRL